ncbi:hypothetical protein [Nostoc sp.]
MNTNDIPGLQRDFMIVADNIERSQNKFLKRKDLDISHKKLVF